MKPIIGITPLYDLEKGNIWMLDDYMEAIEFAGGIPIVLPLNLQKNIAVQVLGMLDGILFPGGQDVTPSNYREVIVPGCGQCFPKLDKMEMMLMKMAYAYKLPVLGICRGHQLMNVVFGGTLYQDIPSQREVANPALHLQVGVIERCLPVHEVTVEKDSLLYRITGESTLQVNSLHHQGVKKVGGSLRTAAVAVDGLVESIESREDQFMLGVQWHPELMYKEDETSQRIFRGFVEACRK